LFLLSSFFCPCFCSFFSVFSLILYFCLLLHIFLSVSHSSLSFFAPPSVQPAQPQFSVTIVQPRAGVVSRQMVCGLDDSLACHELASFSTG
jgi:hypothetical protein